jgi:hypothetical protein
MAPTPCPDPEKLEALSLDGSAVGGSDWKARHPTGMNVIDVGWQSATLGQGFILTAAYQGASGSYTPQQLEATLSFGDIPSITCETAEITGTVSFSRVTALNNYSAQVCGSYDITCTDADSGHTVAVKAFFDSTVQTQSVVGPGR